MQDVQPPAFSHMQIVAQIRNDILAGRLRPGDKVPSAREITREWGVSIATATKVLATLRSEGLAKGVTGIGTVVTLPLVATAKDHLAAMQRTGKIYPLGGRARIVDAGVMSSLAHVAHALGIEVGAPAIRRHRITFQDEVAVAASTSWFDGALIATAPLLARAERLPQGTSGYISEVTGREVVAGRDVLAARLATEQDVADLGVKLGAALLHGENWYFDDAGTVIEFGEFVTAGNRGRSYDYRV